MKRNLLLTTLFILCFGAGTMQAQTTLGETNSLDFDGSDDVVQVPDAASLDLAGGGTLSIEAWVFITGSTGQMIVAKGSGASASYMFGIEVTTRHLNWYNGPGDDYRESSSSVPLNTWTHCAVTNNSGTVTFYINGSSAGGGGVGSAIGADNNIDVSIGAADFSGGQTIGGQMDDVRIWNDVRSATEIDASFRGELCGSESNLVGYWDCNQGTAGGNNSGITTLNDKTSNNNDGTLNNFTKTGSSSNFVSSSAIQQNSLDFDGTDDYVDIPHNAVFNTTTLTIEVWVKPETTTQQWSRIFSSDENHFEITQRSNNLNRFGVYTNSASNSVVNSANWTAGTWYHVAAVWDNTNLELFVDGTSVGSTPATTPTSNNNRFIGDKPSSADHFFHGQLDEMRIWNVARTQMEISNNMNSELTSNTSNLIAYYKFNQGDADQTNTNVTTLVDLSENCNHGTLTNFGLSTGSTSNWTGGAPAILPVEMTYFRGRAVNNGTLLTWQTASEINNQGFEIERSTDGIVWENIGFTLGRGTTFEISDYQFTDTKPHKGMNYYRLKQTDFDSEFEYSDVVSVDFFDGKILGDLKVIPNPVLSGEVTLDFSNPDFEEGTLEIYNTVGQLVQTKVLTSNRTTLSVDNMPKGMYWFSLNLNGQKSVEKVIVK